MLKLGRRRARREASGDREKGAAQHTNKYMSGAYSTSLHMNAVCVCVCGGKDNPKTNARDPEREWCKWTCCHGTHTHTPTHIRNDGHENEKMAIWHDSKKKGRKRRSEIAYTRIANNHTINAKKKLRLVWKDVNGCLKCNNNRNYSHIKVPPLNAAGSREKSTLCPIWV